MTTEVLKCRKVEPKKRIITDLDQSDGFDEEQTRNNKYRQHSKIKISAHLHGRSRSSEQLKQTENDELIYVKNLLSTKNEQMHKLMEKTSELYKTNYQFAQENDRLNNEVIELNEQNKLIAQSLKEQVNKKCSLCLDMKQQVEKLSKENTELKKMNQQIAEDTNMLKTLIYRLNVQIELYQDKLRKYSNKSSEDLRYCIEQSGNVVAATNWGSVNTYTLAPLLNAYEETIQEKGDLIMQHQIELDNFTGTLKNIIDENERLHKEMENLQVKHNLWQDEKRHFQAQIDIYRSKAEIQTKRADVIKEKLAEILRCYEQKVQVQFLEMERLQDTYTRTKNELITLKNSNNSAILGADSLKDCQNLFEELKKQYLNDKERLENELKEFKKQYTKVEEELKHLTEENVKLREIVNKTKQTNSQIRQKSDLLKQNIQEIRESREQLKRRFKFIQESIRQYENNQRNAQNTWNNISELEIIVRNKEAQIRGLQLRYTEDIGKLEKKLQQRDETIKTILRDKAKTACIK